jgi:hypothetical protein
MPQRFTSAPVRGALQVDATEPTSTQILRLTRSIHFQVVTLHDDSPPRTSTVGEWAAARAAGRRWRRLVICASGKARPMHVGVDHRNASRWAAAISGWMALPPPISSDMIGAEAAALVALHHLDGARDGAAVREPLLSDQGRAHVGDDGDVVVVGQLDAGPSAGRWPPSA